MGNMGHPVATAACAEPDATPKARRIAARKALRRFCVAGAAGAFFSGLARTLPADIVTTAFPADWPYTFDVFVRYGYVGWLLVYFFLSSFGIDTEPDHLAEEIAFDLLQSICALFAVYYLGFVVVHHDYGLAGYRAANITILLIGAASWLFFRRRSTVQVNRLRVSAVALAAVSLALAYFYRKTNVLVLTLGGMQLGLWVVLFIFFKIRLQAGPSQKSQASQQRNAPQAVPAPVSTEIAIEQAAAPAVSVSPQSTPGNGKTSVAKEKAPSRLEETPK